MNHTNFYSLSEIYDIAFDFKDIPSECSFLCDVFYRENRRAMASFIDLAAGPGLHAIEMARRGIASAALDLSEEMVDYGLAKAKKKGVQIDYRRGDLIIKD